MTTKFNALDQALDVAGSLLHGDRRTLSEESDMLGLAITGAVGPVTFGTPVGNIQNVSGALEGALGAAASYEGKWLTVSGAFSASNNGTFLIANFIGVDEVDIVNSGGFAEGPNSASLTVRNPYALEDDLNFARTDRRSIKGTTFYFDGLPTYERPTAVGTSVTASLQNLAGKTTDAVAFTTTRLFMGVAIVSGSTGSLLTSVGNLKHADATDRTGVPIEDGADAGAYESSYVEIANPLNQASLEVLSGALAGHRIVGRTRAGTSAVSPDSVDVQFLSVDPTGTLAGAVQYNWESGHPLTVDMYYGYRQRLDGLDDAALRRIMVNGLVGDADMQQDISDIRSSIGTADNATSLAGLLTNTGNFYMFSDLPDASPSVVEALNTLNEQVGDRIYSGTLLVDGETITTSLNRIVEELASGSAPLETRYIERVTGTIEAGMPHAIPAGFTYVSGALSGTGQMTLFWRGVLKDPGHAAGGDNYEETSTTVFTPYEKIREADHINYFIST